MSNGSSKLRTIGQIVRDYTPGLVEILHQEDLRAARYSLWEITNWHWDYDPLVWKESATEEQKREGWEMWVRMERILHKVLKVAFVSHLGEVTEVRKKGPAHFYG